MGFSDLIFPKKCVVCKKHGSYLCEQCFAFLSFDAKSLCLACNNPAFNNLTHPRCKRKYTIDGCFSALAYNKTVQKLIFNFKYKPYLTDLKTVLSDLFYESIIQNEQFQQQIKKGEWILVPIPLSSPKLRRRGYNQAEILTKELAKKFNLSAQDLLTRVKETKTQVGLTNLQRKLNVKDAFLLKPHAVFVVKHKNVLLIDDVVTTGSTLLEAAKVLKKGHVDKVFGLTLARD
jgi:competence protein ComFC